MAFQKRRSDEELLGDLDDDLLILRQQGSLNGTSDACRARLQDAQLRKLALTDYAELVAHLESPPAVVAPEAPTPAAAEALLVTVVGLRSKKQDNGRQRVSIQRGTPLGNPFPVKEDGKTVRTAAEATALFRPWLAEQLADPTSPQSLKVAELRQLLGQGQRLELGCCGHADCHGHAIAEVLVVEEVIQMNHPTETQASTEVSGVNAVHAVNADRGEPKVLGSEMVLPQHLKQLDHPTVQFLATREALEPGRPTFLVIANEKVLASFTEDGELQLWKLAVQDPTKVGKIRWDAPNPEPEKLSSLLWGINGCLAVTTDESLRWLVATSKKQGTTRAGGFYLTSSQAIDTELGVTTLGADTARGLTELCLEWDDISVEEQQARLDLLRDYGFDITTNTSGGASVHGHIHLDRLYGWDEVMPAWKRLTAVMGSDVCVVSKARAMRLPGVVRPQLQVIGNKWVEGDQKLLHLAERRYTLLEVNQVLNRIYADRGLKTDYIATRWSEYRDAYCRRNQCDELIHGWQEPIEAFRCSTEQALVWSRRRVDSDAGGEIDPPVEWLRDELPIGAVIRRAIDKLIEQHGVTGAYELVATSGGKLRDGFEFNFHDHSTDKWAGQSPWSKPRAGASGSSLQIFKETGAFFCWATRRSGKLGNFAIHFCPWVTNHANPSEEDLEHLQIYLNRLAGIEEEVIDSKVDREMVELRNEEIRRFDTARSRRLELSQIFPRELAETLGQRADAFPVAPTAMLAPFLALTASCLGKQFRVRAKEDFTQPMVLWIGLVGSASDMKSPVINEFTRPLKDLDHAALAIYNKLKDEWNRGPGDTPPPNYPPIRLAGSDTTLETFAPLLSRPDVNGLLSCHDELTAYFGGLDAYRSSKGKDRPSWLSMYDGDELRVLRKGSLPIIIRNTAVSVCGGIQPQKLRDLFEADKAGTESGDGFWTRFLWVAPKNPPALLNDRVCSIRELLTDLVHRLSDFNGVEEPITVGLTPDAWGLFKQRSDERTLEARECHSAKEGYLGKQKGRLLRLAGVLWALDHTCKGNPIHTIGDKGPITGEVMERACLLEQFFMDQYDSLMPLVGGSELPTWVARILALSDTTEGGKVTSRDLTQRKWADSGADAKQKLTSLVADFGKGRLIATPRKDQTWWAPA